MKERPPTAAVLGMEVKETEEFDEPDAEPEPDDVGQAVVVAIVSDDGGKERREGGSVVVEGGQRRRRRTESGDGSR